MSSSPKELISRALTDCRGPLIEFAEQLIKTPTENPPGRHYRDCIRLIERRLREFGLQTEVIEVDDCPEGLLPRYCLLASYGDGKETLHFHGHYDVVPAFHESQFVPRTMRGRLFGRGSSDMKGGLAAMVYSIRILQMCGFRLTGRIGLTVVPDEETGGEHGSSYLLKKGLLGKNGVGMLTAEPTGGTIWNGSRGAVSLIVRVRGKAVHAVLQHEGVNAFERMVDVARDLIGLKSEVEKRKTCFPIEPEAARSSILMIGGQSGGGTNFNVVPDECWFTIERRINPEESLEAEKRALLDLLESAKERGSDLSYEILQEGESAGSREEEELARVLSSSVEALSGTRPLFQLCPGLLETRFYANQGIPSYGYGPGSLAAAHGPEEFVDLEEVCRCAGVYALTAARLLTAKG